jgi:hypothetical protein
MVIYDIIARYTLVGTTLQNRLRGLMRGHYHNINAEFLALGRPKIQKNMNNFRR